MSESPVISWTENDQTHSARWHSESGSPAPKRVQIADDRMTAESAYRLACEGTGLLWRGDFQNARQLLQALARRIDKKPAKSRKTDKTPVTLTEAFHLHRQAQSQRARVLAMLLIPFNADYSIPLRRAPDVGLACTEVYGATAENSTAFVASLRELLGLVGAHEWRRNGVEIPALGQRIHPYYGVFSPVRGEYLDLLAKAPLPGQQLAFDIGTGTGVISAILAQRGVQRIIATDQDERALSCARDNLQRLGMAGQVEVIKANLFPPGRAALIVCNPPWLPARPNSPIEHAIYDQDSSMLRGFLSGVAAHLEPGGEAWLIMSDLAEHLGLRSSAELWSWIEAGGLEVIGKMDIKPRHGKATDVSDPLHAARSAEITSLWRLKIKVAK
ncbi:methyltransferase [Undibacterium sp. Jales W-56]|uniref:methyltransferase n=1 Tax=Undibacterium sp. Jales W-56 TaxID=2897325 RepID=UPI0021D1712B|nr:methyltransferase [Undibacterium sp. Jales W-56]MCU6433001.1 methyltransferase [Undibacterium sp. Jales W-56]